MLIIHKKKNNQTHADGAGTNKQHVATKNTAKLDRETEELKHKSITPDVAKTIQQGRQAKGWSQKDLATVNELRNSYHTNTRVLSQKFLISQF